MQKASNHQIWWSCDIADLIIEHELELGSHAETYYSWVSISLLGKVVLRNLGLCCFVINFKLSCNFEGSTSNLYLSSVIKDVQLFEYITGYYVWMLLYLCLISQGSISMFTS